MSRRPEQDRRQVGKLVQAVQEEPVSVHTPSSTGDTAANETGEHGVRASSCISVALCCCRLAQLWLGLASRRLARRTREAPQTLAGLHYVAFAMDAAAPTPDVIGMVQNMEETINW